MPLRAANAVKDEFLGLVSHELRTPVTTIYGNARLLQGTGELPERTGAMVADIAIDAERLLGLVENLLLMTRAASEQERIDLEPQVLGHAVRQIVDVFRRHHPGREIRLVVDGGELIVDGDQGYLELLVGNLLGNADKYSPITEPIEVVLQRVGDEAHVTVRDRGIGIPDESDRLFTAFYRTDAARRMSGGLGIGLSASRHVVAILGGRIWARPREGGGSEFGFALPFRGERPD